MMRRINDKQFAYFLKCKTKLDSSKKVFFNSKTRLHVNITFNRGKHRYCGPLLDQSKVCIYIWYTILNLFKD